MKTGLVMENKSSPELTLSFLLMAALCSEAFIIERFIYVPSERMNWTDARLYCQRNHVDLVTWNIFPISFLANRLVKNNIKQVWIGLHRDHENVSVWKWINLKTGEGISGDDVSQSSNWANGQQSSQCAIVSDEDLMWHSDRCSGKYEFYCTVGDSIIHHKINLSWYSASHYCQNKVSDLATVSETNAGYFKKSGWIGLYREVGETWSWIGDGPSSYRNWAPREPVNTDCGFLKTATIKWYSSACSKKLNFVCFDDNLVVVNESKTWEDALQHCRAMETPCVKSSAPCVDRYDFLSLEALSDYNYVRDRIHKATTDEVWTGLRFLGGEWWWVNRQKLEDQGMLPDCPPQGKHCGTLSKYDTNNWIIRDCSERRNFICYRRIMRLWVANKPV